jgi:hypothetical protein
VLVVLEEDCKLLRRLAPSAFDHRINESPQN